jgi:hypothetical protein
MQLCGFVDGIVASSHNRPNPSRAGFSLGFWSHQRATHCISIFDARKIIDVQTYYLDHAESA